MNYGKSILLLFLVLTVLTYTACPDHCQDCDEAGTVCFTCSGDYEVNVFGGCHANSIDRCIIYGPSDQCFRCQPTYSLVDGKCVKTFTGCANEGNPGQCFQCSFGLTLNGVACEGVINCADFSGGKCNKCKDGYTLNGKICVDKSVGCAQTRPADGICSKCKQNYFQSGYQCFEKKSKNNRCYVQEGVDKCLYCKSGYNVVDGKCLLNKQMAGGQSTSSFGDSSSSGFSSSTMTTSTISTTSTNLNFGQSGFGHSDSFGSGSSSFGHGDFPPAAPPTQPTTPPDPNCADSQGGRCQQCKQNYYVDITGKCKQLPPFCSIANMQNGDCLECVKDYQIVSPGSPCTKILVIENCQVLDRKNVGKCLVCAERYFPDDKKCTKVSNLCRDYNPQNGKCNSCAIQGFTLDNGRCIDLNCDLRKDDDTCTVCKTNFAFNNAEKICKWSDPNCKSLTTTSCQECRPGYYLARDRLCRLLPPNCIKADVAGSGCQTCADRFYLSGTSCSPVSPTCNGYNPSNGFCTSCNQNLVLQPDGTCAAPIVFTPPVVVLGPQVTQPIVQPVVQPTNTIVSFGGQKSDLNCREYNGAKCVKCSTRYYVGLDGRCVPVNPLCRESNSAGQCTSCYPGYRVNVGKCIISQSIDANCKSFQNNKCSECYQGFYYNENDKICKKLNPLCKSSNLQNGACTSCYNGYNVNPANGNCEVFFKDPNCKQFKPDGGCKTCSNRYYVNSNGKCSAANPLCRQYNQFNGACTSCYPGYGVKDGNCAPGVSTDPNCKNFQGSGCAVCVNGFYIGGDGKCKQASPLCKTFDPNNGNCLTCYNGYTVANGACVINQNQDPNCKKFDLQNNCQGCYQGYILIKGKCMGQNPLCKGVDMNTGGCTSCWSGYSLTLDGNCAVQQASQNPNGNDPYCIQMMNGVCSKCSSGYYYNQGQGLCAQFDPLCKSSDETNGACTSCYLGYSLANGQCVAAPAIQIPNCLTVGATGECSECVEGTFYKDRACVQVSILCQGYNKQTGDCTGCVSGYFFQDNSCVFPAIYDQNCVRYENSYCSRCRLGYYLANYVCQPIDPNCVNFNYNTTSCDICANNLFPNGPVCQ